MGSFRAGTVVAMINFRRWMKDIRVRFTFVFIACLLVFYLNAFTVFGLKTGQSCSICLLPLLFESGTISVNLTKTLLHIGMLLLLCDAPFVSDATAYMVLRSRRNGWWIGECLYIMAAALVYTVFLTAVSSLIVLPVAEFGNEWGSIVHQITFGDGVRSGIEIAKQNQFQKIYPVDVVRYLYPYGSQLYTFFAVWMSCSFLGLVMYLISLVKRNVLWGMSVAGIFIFLDPFLTYLGEKRSWIQMLSPVCWTSIDAMQVTNRFYFVSVPMAVGAYLVLLVILCIAIWRVSRRAAIELIR